MSSFRARPGRMRRTAAILGIALIASGFSVAAAPAAAADVTVCDGKGNCFTYRTLEPEVCKLEKLPEVDPVLSPPKITGCGGRIAGGRDPVVVLPGTGNPTVIGVPRCPPLCGSEPTRPTPPPGF
ncbi:MAG: hypothetical protein ACRDRP_10555 [Pseudonocardiaceae bacterium]